MDRTACTLTDHPRAETIRASMKCGSDGPLWAATWRNTQNAAPPPLMRTAERAIYEVLQWHA